MSLIKTIFSIGEKSLNAIHLRSVANSPPRCFCHLDILPNRYDNCESIFWNRKLTTSTQEFNNKKVIAGAIIPLAIATIFIVGRCYSRVFLLRNWGWDDYMIISAWVGKSKLPMEVLDMEVLRSADLHRLHR